MFEAVTKLAKRIFGDANDREVRRMQPIVDRINALESGLKQLDDHALRSKTAEFKERIERGQPLDDLLPEAFAVVREGAVRALGMRHYDCQMIGGIVIHQGRIAEMKTGEGKTLVATSPLYLNALAGKGAHLITVNDYLAQRDAEWMGQLYRWLGMSTGIILSGDRNPRMKREAYACDITYGTNNEFGFDYLRDNMKFSLEDYVQRGFHFGIVDEVDSILVDEARTPLIISGPAEASIELYTVVDAVIPLLQDELDYTVDEKGRSATLTEDGVRRVEERLGIDNLFDPQNMEVLHHVQQSLKAHHLFKRDRDYVVRNGKVTIVDEFTGRLMDGRRWSDGLHQAVEAKEKVNIEQESQVYATITYQNLFRMYGKLAGMTGTAETEAAEFASIYNLDTIVIPTNRPVARVDEDDIVFKTQMEKFRAVVADIQQYHARGTPILVGTTSVEKSEIVAQLLRRSNIPHEILNAKNHAREASIIAQAGRRGAVTISTNMAGRGTDIKLGGNPEEMAKLECDPVAEPERFQELVRTHAEECAREAELVKAAGGLRVIGTERHESRRIDNQLRGRSGRQGDPGSSRFYLSLEDDLLRIFGSDKITVWMERMGLKDDEPIEHRWITGAIENAQKKVEGHNFQQRKNLLEYDDVMNYQRKGVYEIRRRALSGEGVREMLDESVASVVEDIMDDYCPEGVNPEQWDVESLRKNLEKVFTLRWEDTAENLRDHSRAEMRRRMLDEAGALLDAQVAQLGQERFERLARNLVLQFTDQLWKDHLLAIDRLRQGVGLRGYGQRNPLLEYKREAFHMYLMMGAIRDESVVSRLLRAQAEEVPAEQARPALRLQAPRPAPQVDAAPAELPPMPAAPPAQPQQVRAPRQGVEAYLFAVQYGIRRNDPCPCGSGLKHKKCCYEFKDEGDALLAELQAAQAVTVSGGLGAEESATEGEELELDPTQTEAEAEVEPSGGFYADPSLLHAAEAEAEAEAEAASPEAEAARPEAEAASPEAEADAPSTPEDPGVRT